MEINEDKQMRRGKTYLFKVCCSKGVGHHDSCLPEETQDKQKRGASLLWESTAQKDADRAWEAGFLEVGIPCGCLGKHIWHSLTGPKLEVGTKIKDVSVINEVLAILG